MHINQRRIEGRYLMKGISVRQHDSNITKTTNSTLRKSYIENLDRIKTIERNVHLLNKMAGSSICGQFATILTDKWRRLLYCYVPKVGSTFWSRVLDIIIRHRNISNPFDIPDQYVKRNVMSNIRNHEINSTGWIKFLFVRNPYERPLSTYIDKFVSPNMPFYAAGIAIIRKYRPNANYKSSACGHDVSFEEFISAVVSENIQDPHWCPIYTQCRLKDIQYTYVGKMETFARDTEMILEKIDTRNTIKQFSSLDTVDDVIAINIYRAFHILNNNGIYRKVNCSFIDINYALIRVWKVLQLKAIIDYHLPYPFQNIPEDKLTRHLVMDRIKKAIDVSFTNESRIAVKKHVLQSAYASLPDDLIFRLREKFKPDFILFGYNDTIDNVFDEITWQPFQSI